MKIKHSQVEELLRQCRYEIQTSDAMLARIHLLDRVGHLAQKGRFTLHRLTGNDVPNWANLQCRFVRQEDAIAVANMASIWGSVGFAVVDTRHGTEIN